MKTRPGLAVMVTAALLALCGTATAVAAGRPAPGNDAATRDATARKGPKCDRLDHVISGLERATSNLEKKIARVEEKIAGGELSPEQLARARAFLARLQIRLEKFEALIERLETKFEQKCSGDD